VKNSLKSGKNSIFATVIDKEKQFHPAGTARQTLKIKK
jgi:hypothetical protein